MVFDIPRLDGVEIDGEPADWAEAGFSVHAMTPNTDRLSAALEGGGFRLAWDDAGLLLLAEIIDDARVEAPTAAMWEGDSVEIFAAAEPGSGDMVQFIMAPGLDPEHGERRVLPFDKRSSETLKADPIAVDFRASAHDTGYTLEARVPWAQLGVTPAVGLEPGVQVILNDSDAPGHRAVRVWYPSFDTWADSGLTHRVRLAAAPSPPVRVLATAGLERFRRMKIDLAAVPDLAGRAAVVLDGGRTLGELVLAEDQGAATATLRRPVSVADTPTRLKVRIDGLAPLPIDVPDRDKQAADTLLEQPVVCESYILSGPAFPAIDFAQPSLMEDALGLYNVVTMFYNAEHQPVESAEEPGRYGAVVRFTTDHGRTITRYRTLYRPPSHVDPWDYELDATITLPEHFGVDPVVNERRQDEIVQFYQWAFTERAASVPYPAMLLAGLAEIDADDTAPATAYNAAWARDRQWWVDQKRQLNGNAERFATPFPGPRPVSGPPAPVLHEAPPEDAGMSAAGVAAIDALLTEWAENSDEAFIACIARRGVVVLHKAYGTRDGEPMTTDTKSRMASLSKLVSGAQVMMAVDAGLLDLDEPIDTYLPELRDAGFTRVPTLRHLYTHTAGMSTHRGEVDHDLEHLVAEYAPHFAVGEKYSYNGMSLELGLKILEQVTGLAYPRFAQRHLLEPLGCADTDALNASWNTASTARDMAAIGQMLLNRGAYGDLRFMSEQTFEQMLPRPLTITLGPDADTQYGIGCDWYDEDGLSGRCFGHGAASSATLRIDLDLDLVISMTRNNAGENFEEYHPRFIRAVADAITDLPPSPAARPEATTEAAPETATEKVSGATPE
ncbi:MAG: serine hydrolase [Planctomycetota bacterium]